MIDQAISHYRVVEKLGEGGMGVVYKAEDARLGRLVALKFLTERAAQDEESRRRFLYEARATAALNHPNICTVYEIDEDRGFLAMEYVTGETVEARRKRRELPIDEALDIVIQTAEGLQVAHETGIVHRDIKSANLMVTDKGKVKIMDFGLARLAGRTRLTRNGSSLGTPAYMAPEVYRGEPADERSDIWSLGVVLYELIAGRVPFDGDFEAAVVYGVLNEEPKPLAAQRADVPLELDRLVTKALAKDRGLRYQRVVDLAADLNRFQRDADEAAPILWAASRGDLAGLKRLAVKFSRIDIADYDYRTALHLAASEGHLHVVSYLLESGVDVDPRDRWGGTPLDDAIRHGHREVVRLLKSYGAASRMSGPSDADKS
jgi:serine/threonine protein kinase